MTPTASRHRCALLFGLAATCLLGAAWAAALVRPAAAEAAPTIFPVCLMLGGQAGPDIAGNVVVWTDNRNGNLDIYGRDLGSGKPFAVCTNPAGQDNPSVTRTLVGASLHYVAVWVDDRNTDPEGATDIRGRDLTSHTDFTVASGAYMKSFPEIAGNWVVWIQATQTSGLYHIMARDLSAKHTYLIAASRVLSPVGVSRRVVGGKSVYTAVYTSAAGDISARDLPGGAPFAVAQTSRFEWSPDISGNRVVWWETGGRVMLKNIVTGKRTFLAIGARPRVDGSYVVWDGGGHGGTFTITYTAGAAVYARNVAAGSNVIRLAQSNQACLFPAVSGRTMVWETGPASRVLSHIHIYGARL